MQNSSKFSLFSSFLNQHSTANFWRIGQYIQKHFSGNFRWWEKKGNQNVLTQSEKLYVFQINPRFPPFSFFVINTRGMFKEIAKNVYNLFYLIKHWWFKKKKEWNAGIWSDQLWILRKNPKFLYFSQPAKEKLHKEMANKTYRSFTHFSVKCEEKFRISSRTRPGICMLIYFFKNISYQSRAFFNVERGLLLDALDKSQIILLRAQVTRISVNSYFFGDTNIL